MGHLFRFRHFKHCLSPRGGEKFVFERADLEMGLTHMHPVCIVVVYHEHRSERTSGSTKGSTASGATNAWTVLKQGHLVALADLISMSRILTT